MAAPGIKESHRSKENRIALQRLKAKLPLEHKSRPDLLAKSKKCNLLLKTKMFLEYFPNIETKISRIQ
jgi:hypothetical protein